MSECKKEHETERGQRKVHRQSIDQSIDQSSNHPINQSANINQSIINQSSDTETNERMCGIEWNELRRIEMVE
jgi:hypothetical protein